jgi:hypothetical protein
MRFIDIVTMARATIRAVTLDAASRRGEEHMRYFVLVATLSLSAVILFGAAQRSTSNGHPTYVDAFDARPVVASPDGKFGVTVTGPKKSYLAWLTIDPSGFPGGAIQVWPLQANGEVLWRPDSTAFAFTDNRYANLAYVLVFGTHFNIGEGGAELGVPIEDLTSAVRKNFEERVQKYYSSADYDTRLFYANALRWIGNDQLLVGVNAKTVGDSELLPNRGIKDWFLGYLVDVPHKSVLHEFETGQMLSQYGIDLEKQNR